MELVTQLVIGAVAGVLAMFATYRRFPGGWFGWIGAVVVGLIGGRLGGMVFDLLGLQSVNWLGSLIVAFAGAFPLLYLLQKITQGGSSEP